MDKFDEIISAKAQELLDGFAAFHDKQGGDIDSAFQSWTIVTLAKIQFAVENLAKAIDANKE